MKLLSAIAALAMLGALATITPAAADPKPHTAICTITSHPAGCVQPEPIWVHATTEFGPVDHECGRRSPRRD